MTNKSIDWLVIFNILSTEIAKTIPNFSIRYKDKVYIHKVLYFFIRLFNKRYMTSYTTTLYPHVDFPNEEYVKNNPKQATKILAHEFVHLWDRHNLGIRWSIGYLLPQFAGIIVILLSTLLLVIFSNNWFFIGISVGVLLLAPIPAYWRMRAELRGYSMNVLINVLFYGSLPESTKTWVINIFTGPMYYFMWPMRKTIVRALEAAEKNVHDKKSFEHWFTNYPNDDMPYNYVRQMFIDHTTL